MIERFNGVVVFGSCGEVHIGYPVYMELGCGNE